MTTTITDIKISDPKLKKLVATAQTGQLLSSPGHDSEVDAQSPVNQPGMSLKVNNLYVIAAKDGNNIVPPLANMQYLHTTGGVAVFQQIS